MITTSSGFYGNVAKNAKFAYGLAPLPYYPDVAGAPQNTVIGGASLWVMAGKKPDDVQGRGQVLQLPVEPRGAVGEPQAHRLPADHDRRLQADREVAASTRRTRAPTSRSTQMIRKTTDKSRGIRLGNFVQIRAIERRGARAGLGRQEDAPRKRSTRS